MNFQLCQSFQQTVYVGTSASPLHCLSIESPTMTTGLRPISFSVLAQYNDYTDYNDRRSDGNEQCFEHEEFPEPSECCTRPHWINQYLVRPCRFSNTPRGGQRQEQETCSVSCGVYRINMGILNNQVNSVRLFRPSRLRGYGDEDWKRTVLSALKLCKRRITSMVGIRIREGQEMEQCDEANDVFADCLDEQLFLQCPERVWIRTSGCDLSKSHLMQGCPFRSLTEQTKRQRDDRYNRNRRRGGSDGYGQDDRNQYDDEYDGYDGNQGRNRGDGNYNSGRNNNGYDDRNGYSGNSQARPNYG
ncbi:uncharacterized protein LOC135708497 [Ochlerotatus camptorhynchus]|uniref:uncharacterized protein LOC135708497 n=1 Tax=Ochlerotatus camptorhynchus TaxID=644619 RepID=UPI0031D933A9